MSFKRSDLIQSFFYHKGVPLSFENFPFWIDLINSNRLSKNVDQSERKICLKCSRQVAKSTNIGILGTGLSLENKNFVCIITQPTDTQISRFSVDVLKSIHKDSIVTDVFYYDNKRNERQVKNKSFINGSRIILANIFASVLSARGIPGDAVFLDEYQDTPPDHAEIVISSTQRSPYKYIIKSGTPLEPENQLQVEFDNSTASEWVVRCGHCGHWNGPLGLRNIGHKGLICAKCNKSINARYGMWVDAIQNSNCEGYHINELCIPRDFDRATSWRKIVDDVLSKEPRIIHNEMLGESYSDSKHPISTQDVCAACNNASTYIKDVGDITSEMKRYAFAGLDWALEMKPNGKDRNIKSYTMFTVAHFDVRKRKLVVDHVKRFYSEEADDPDFVIAYVLEWLRAFDVKIIGMDYGVGHKENQRIAAAYGPEKCMEFIYVGELVDRVLYDFGTNKWEIHRSKMIEEFIEEFKNNSLFEFAKFEGETSEYSKDLTTVYKYMDPLKRTTRFGKAAADDWMHNLIYLMLAYKMGFELLNYETKGQA